MLSECLDASGAEGFLAALAASPKSSASGIHQEGQEKVLDAADHSWPQPCRPCVWAKPEWTARRAPGEPASRPGARRTSGSQARTRASFPASLFLRSPLSAALP